MPRGGVRGAGLCSRRQSDGPEGWDEAEFRALGLLGMGVARSQA